MTEEEKKQHRCCFAGNNMKKLDMNEDTIKAWLSREIDKAILQGYTTFITGMAVGAQLWGAQIVLEKKKTNSSLHLIAASPFNSFNYKWNDSWKQVCTTVWNSADYRITMSDSYCKGVYQMRDFWMVDRCSKMIACHNGDPGGTQNIIEYAKSKNVDIVLLANEILFDKAYPYNLLDRLSPDETWPDDIEARLPIALFSLRSLRDIEMIERRYKENKTLQSIGNEAGLSRERVRQLIERSERHLMSCIQFLRGKISDDTELHKMEWFFGELQNAMLRDPASCSTNQKDDRV